MTKCLNCDCNHDNSHGFGIGECDCHRIGGSFIYDMPHEYIPDENAVEDSDDSPVEN